MVKLIQEQGELRDQNIWQGSLREEKPQKNLSKVQTLIQTNREIEGLPEFIFHHNFLGVAFFKGLTKLVGLDRYCRKLDIRKNNITETLMTDEFFQCLYCNETLINLDIRDNPRISRESLRKVALILLKNVEIAKKQLTLLSKGWLDRNVLMLTKQEWPALVRGLNILVKDNETAAGGD